MKEVFKAHERITKSLRILCHMCNFLQRIDFIHSPFLEESFPQESDPEN